MNLVEESENSRLFVILDNRRIPFHNFESEANFVSYYGQILQTVSKWISLSKNIKWIESTRPIYICASSPSSTEVVGDVNLNLAKISETFQPKFTNPGRSNGPKITWGQYIADALSKVFRIIQQLPKTDVKLNNVVVIYSNDINLIGDNNTESVDEAVQSVHNFFNEFLRSFNITLRIICVYVSNSEGRQLPLLYNNNLTTIHRIFKDGIDLTFQTILNSPIYYEQEMKHILSIITPKYYGTLNFPKFNDNFCSLSLYFIPMTIQSAKSIHPGFTSPQLFSLSSRNEVDPLMISGSSVSVTYPRIESQRLSRSSSEDDKKIFMDSFHENQAVFISFVKLLAKENLVLILQLPSSQGTALQCDEYWLLIPPTFESHDFHTLSMIKLIDRDEWIGLFAPPHTMPSDQSEESRQGEGLGLLDQDEEEGDLLMDYLQSSIIRSGMMGSPTRYNPTICTSGWINAMVQSQFEMDAVALHRPPPSSVMMVRPTLAPSSMGSENKGRGRGKGRGRLDIQVDSAMNRKVDNMLNRSNQLKQISAREQPPLSMTHDPIVLNPPSLTALNEFGRKRKLVQKNDRSVEQQNLPIIYQIEENDDPVPPVDRSLRHKISSKPSTNQSMKSNRFVDSASSEEDFTLPNFMRKTKK